MVCDRAGMDVVAAQDDHVVHAAADAADQPGQRPAARARRRIDAHQIAGAIAQQRAADAAEVRDDQLALRPRRHGLARRRVDDLDDELGFEHVQAAGVGDALHGHRPDFGHAGVVEDAGAPGRLDAAARGRDAAARLAGHDDRPHRRTRQVDAFLAGRLRQPQGVGRRTEHDGRLVVAEKPQAGGAAHAAAGQAEAAVARGGVEGGPEAEERPEREREKQPFAGPDAASCDKSPPSCRASRSSFRPCPASAAAGRTCRRSGRSGGSARPGTSTPCRRAGVRPGRPAVPPWSSTAAGRGRPATAPTPGRGRRPRTCGRRSALDGRTSRSRAVRRSPCKRVSSSRVRSSRVTAP